MSKPETPETTPVPESTKPSRLSKVRNNAAIVGFYAIPIIGTGVAVYFGAKMTNVKFETARLNLETAKLLNANAA